MKSLTATTSTALQLVYVISLLGFILPMIKVFQAGTLYSHGDPKLVAGAISSAFVDLLLGVAVGLVGAVLARVVLRDRQQCPPWFVQLSAVFAWAWILFVPIGTVIGVLMLRWRRRPGASDSSA